MKKLLALCAFALIAGYGQAQTTAGRMMIGGNLGITKSKSEGFYGESKATQLTISSQLGYFVADNIAIGLGVNYYYQKNSALDIDIGFVGDNKFYETSITPFARYYIVTPNDKFAFYAQALVGIGFTKADYYNLEDDIKGENYQAQLSPGFTYFFNDAWALDLMLEGLSYQSNDRNTDSDFKNDKNSSLTVGRRPLTHI
jgi:outer membrane protein